MLPEPSVARADKVCVPLPSTAVFHDQLQFVVPLAVCQAPPSTEVCTDATVEPLLEAPPVTETTPDSVEPDPGAEMLTAGGGITLLTDTDSLETADVLPELSVARADRVWVPLPSAAVFHDQLQLVVPLAVCQAPPSTEVCTDATVELLLEAPPVTETTPQTVDPDPGVEMLTAGGTIALLVTLFTDTDSLETADLLPELSMARAERVWVPLPTALVFHDQLQLVVPLAICQVPPSTEVCTEATAFLLDAEPATVTVLETVELVVGAEILRTGATATLCFDPPAYAADDIATVHPNTSTEQSTSGA
jgi:hypothetical protein